MRWKTDWLFGLILRDVEQLWQRAKQHGMESSGLPPNYLILTQHTDVSVRPESGENTNLLQAGFVGPIVQQWRFDEAGVRPKIEADVPLGTNTAIQGMFYQVGAVNFGVSADRKLVPITYVVGPRYAAWRVFEVTGQGRSGRLVRHPDFLWSIS